MSTRLPATNPSMQPWVVSFLSLLPIRRGITLAHPAGASWRSRCLPGGVPRPVSCAFRALTALVCDRFSDPADPPTLRGKHGGGTCASPDFSGSWAARTEDAHGDPSRQRSRFHAMDLRCSV